MKKIKYITGRGTCDECGRNSYVRFILKGKTICQKCSKKIKRKT